jgi:hypothetical protein
MVNVMNSPNSNYATIALMFCLLAALDCSDKSTSNKIPNAPSGLTGQAISTSSIILNWTDNSDNETNFLIYRMHDSTWTQTAALPTNTQTFNDSLLTDSTSYYYRVSARNDAGESNPSDSISLSTFAVGHSPTIPSNPSPTIDSTGVSIRPRLWWSCSDPDEDTLHYDLYLGVGSYLNLIASDIAERDFQADSLNYNTRYNWRVIAKDNHSHITSGPVWHFTTKRNQPPSTPHQPFPANGAVGVARNVILSWQCIDPDSDLLTYNVYFGNGQEQFLVASDLTQNFFSPGLLLFSTSYSWRIVAKDSYDNQTNGPLWSFITYDSAYAVTVLLQGMGQITKLPDRQAYSYGDTVNLTAIADQGWSFFGWAGDTTGNANPLSLVIQRNLDITAVFHQGSAPVTIGGIVSWPGHALTSHTYAFADTFADGNPFLVAQATVNPNDGSFLITINNIANPLHLRFEAHDDVNNNGIWNPIDSGDGWMYYDLNGDNIWSIDDTITVAPGDQITGINIVLRLYSR